MARFGRVLTAMITPFDGDDEAVRKGVEILKELQDLAAEKRVLLDEDVARAIGRQVEQPAGEVTNHLVAPPLGWIEYVHQIG